MKILIAYDGSEYADAALNDLKRAGLPKKAEAVVLSVVESWLPPPSSFEMVEAIDHRTEALALTRRASAYLRTFMPEWQIEPETGFGSPTSVILEKADQWNPDLIVVGSHGRSALGRFFLGSISQKIVSEALCSVRVARRRDEESKEPIRIIIGVDGSRYSDAAVQAVAARHWPKGSKVRIVNAALIIPPTASELAMTQIADWIAKENEQVKEMMETAEQNLRATGLITSVVVKEEEPKRLLISEAESWKADCIFVGAKGKGRIERLMMGSTSSGVAAQAHCSVEVVRTLQVKIGNELQKGH